MARTYLPPNDGGVFAQHGRLVSRRGKYWKAVHVQGDVVFFPPGGTGELSSNYPDALVTVDGVPVSAQVLVRYRTDTPGERGDGVLVGYATASPSGEWNVSGLNGGLKYDVIARHPDHNDVMASRVAPRDLPRLSYFAHTIYVGEPLNYMLPAIGGVGGITISIDGALPSGVTFDGTHLKGAWPTGTIGDYPLSVTVTDAASTATTRVFTLSLAMRPL